MAMPADVPRWGTGVAALDAVLAGGMAQGRMHEVYAADPEDAGGAAGFAALLGIGLAEGAGRSRPLVWIREGRARQGGGVLQGAGLAELGGVPQDCLLVEAQDGKALLRASLDAVRCGGLGAVIAHVQGALRELDLTATRRLALAARQSGVTLVLLRIDAQPVPSAAETRWSVTSAPSRALAANAPGAPTFDIELLRQRSGRSGLRWRLEWDRDRRLFRDTAISGAVVSVPARRPAADTGAGSLRRVA